jgi:glycosyltransferase involved in cell wall biosynthesis
MLSPQPGTDKNWRRQDGASVRILICEPEANGHHFRYVQSIAAQAIRRGHTPILATTATAQSHRAYSELRAAIPAELMPTVSLDDPMLSFLPRFSRWQRMHLQWRSWLSFRRCFRGLPADHRPDFVLLPYFDDLDIAVALAGSPFDGTPWAGIVMRQRFQHPAVNAATPRSRFSPLRRWIFERTLRSRTLGAIVTIDETLTEYYARRISQPKLRFIPEPADLLFTIPKNEARRRLGLPEDGKYILLYGSIHMRKGLAEAITALESLPEKLGARLLIFGPQDPAEREYIAVNGADLRYAGRLFEFDRFASMEDESLAFSAADIVWVAYSRHYSPSSVQGKACRAGCALIASREANLGWTTSRYGLGAAVNVSDPASVRRALIELLSADSSAWDQYRENGFRYAAGRNSEGFGEAIIGLAQAVGSRQDLVCSTAA